MLPPCTLGSPTNLPVASDTNPAEYWGTRARASVTTTGSRQSAGTTAVAGDVARDPARRSRGPRRPTRTRPVTATAMSTIARGGPSRSSGGGCRWRAAAARCAAACSSGASPRAAWKRARNSSSCIAELLRNLRPQADQSAVDARLGGDRGDALDPAHLLEREVEVVAQHQRQPVPVGKPSDGPAQVGAVDRGRRLHPLGHVAALQHRPPPAAALLTALVGHDRHE